MKKFFKEFKEFIAKGNIVDLAVAVIIGSAFSAIVTALTNKIIMPLVNWVLAICGGTEGLESAYTILSAGYQKNDLGEYILDANGNRVIDLATSIYIDWGAFIAAIFNFLIIAMTLFIIVKTINASKKKIENINNGLVEKAKARKEKKNKKGEPEVEETPVEEVVEETPVEEPVATEAPAPAPANTTDSMKDSTNIEMISLLREIRDAVRK